MTLLEHLTDTHFWDILFKDLSICLGAVGFFVVVFWIAEKIHNRKTKDLTSKLAEQDQWQKRFKK
jgi:hypothetical protein|tara:strand:- start:508 stop:702 length:195 start_codon:yes stop_codon:yes gene_type:complete